MAINRESRKDGNPTVYHLMGAACDVGGILSSVRSMIGGRASSWGCNHVVVNASGYRETRRPALQYRNVRWLCADQYRNMIALFVRSLLAAWALLGDVRDKRVDLFHAHSRGGILCACWLSLISKLPVVVTNHTYARNKCLYRWLARCPRITSVFLTPEMVKYYGVDASLANVNVISEGFAPSLLNRPLCVGRLAAAARPPSKTDPLRLIGVGSWFPWKKWDTIVEALALLPADTRERLKFDHWGAVPSAFEAEHAHVLQRVRESGLTEQVCFHGSVSSVVSELSAADLFVVASVNEPCSVALLEALALGLPVVASDSGGNRDIICEGQDGVFFETGNAGHLADILARIVHGEVRFAPPAIIREKVRFRSGDLIGAEYEVLYKQRLYGKGISA